MPKVDSLLTFCCYACGTRAAHVAENLAIAARHDTLGPRRQHWQRLFQHKHPQCRNIDISIDQLSVSMISIFSSSISTTSIATMTMTAMTI